jgi:hypothetical protein
MVSKTAVGIVSVLLLCAAAPAASASSVRLSGGTLVYDAAPGETNLMDVTRAGGVLRITDPGATIDAHVGCQRRGPHFATCRGAGVDAIFVNAGDGDDSVALDGLSLPATLVGGDGNDRLVGGAGPDTLDGGAGDDTLQGGGGDDHLDGGDGNDSMNGGQGDDVLRGAAGDDDLSGDNGDDVLDGSDGFDTLDGGPGSDVLLGGNDADQLTGGPGADQLFGGPGNDFLFAGDGELDLIDCGDGQDATTFDPFDARDLSCEVVPLVPLTRAVGTVHFRSGGRIARPRGARPYILVRVPARGTITVRAHFSLRGRRNRTVASFDRAIQTNRWETIRGVRIPRSARSVRVNSSI